MNFKKIKTSLPDINTSLPKLPILKLDFLPDFTTSGLSKAIALLTGIIVIVFITSMLTTSLLRSYNQKIETEKKIAEMEQFLDDWHKTNDELNSSSMRPIKKEQADMVQTNIIFKLQALQLNLVSLKEAQQTKETNGRSYILEFDGAYEQTMQFINELQSSDALIGISHLSLTAQKGMIKAKVNYKIYTKEGEKK